MERSVSRHGLVAMAGVVLLFQAACASDAVPCDPHPLVPIGTNFFTDISVQSGIQLNNFIPNPPKPIPYNDHARLGFADIDGDGFDDIVMHSLFPNVQKGIPFEHLVFLSNGDGTFRDFSDASGLRAVQAAFFVFGDVDNDGDEDCFAGLDIPLPGLGNDIYLNDGAGHFTKKAGAGFDGTIGATNTGDAVFADFNGDAKLDLFIGNGQTSVFDTNQLFFGNGDGTFTEMSGALHGGEVVVRETNGLVTCDFDDDGDLDVLVSTYSYQADAGHHVLWRNDGNGGFDDVADQVGFGAQIEGNYWLAETGNGTAPQPGVTDVSQWTGGNGFGIECQDVNGDGLPDIYLAQIGHPDRAPNLRSPDVQWSDPTLLLINQGPSAGYTFKNEFLARKLPFNEGDIDNAIIDFDNDGMMDLAVGRDSKYEGNYSKAQVDQKAWFGLFHQLGDGTFESVGLTSGINDPNDTSALPRMKAAGNIGWSDIDHDGDLDVLIGGGEHGGGRANFLFRNEIGSKNGWLGIKLRGDGVNINRDAIGARVTITGLGGAVGKILTREVKSSRGTYDSMDTRTLLIGVGDLGCDWKLDVRWPNGTGKTFTSAEVPLQTYVTIDYTLGLILPTTSE